MKNGFTLVELLVSISVFVVVMVISMGSIVNIYNSNRQSRAMKVVTTNLSLAIETMSRELRFGKDYHCASASATLSFPLDPANCNNGDKLVSFVSSDGIQITYRLNNNLIEKLVGTSTAVFIPITAPEVVVDDLVFYITGADEGDPYQPKVHIKLRGHAGQGNSRSDLMIQTLVSQRATDFEEI